MQQVEVPEDPGYLPYPVRFMQRSTREALTFEPSLGKLATISYKLTKQGRIRVRVVWKADKRLVLRTLLDWTVQGFAVHTLQWDGRDASGNIVDNGRCFIAFEEHTQKHGDHDPERCREMDVEVVYPDGPGARIRDVSEIEARLVRGGYSPPGSGYRLRGYIDYAPAFDVPLPTDAETFHLPEVRDVAPGQHLISINVDDGHDHVGVAGVRVAIQP
jgi:hypothetical protein